MPERERKKKEKIIMKKAGKEEGRKGKYALEGNIKGMNKKGK